MPELEWIISTRMPTVAAPTTKKKTVTTNATLVADSGENLEFTYATIRRCRRTSILTFAALTVGVIGSVRGQRSTTSHADTPGTTAANRVITRVIMSSTFRRHVPATRRLTSITAQESPSGHHFGAGIACRIGLRDLLGV